MSDFTVTELVDLAQGYDEAAARHRTCGEDCTGIVSWSDARYRAFTARKWARRKARQ